MTIRQGDCRAELADIPEGTVNCCVTSPPYWGLRDYEHPGQFGIEDTPEKYTERLVEAFREVRRVLRDDGTLWLNLGDSYAEGGNGVGTGKQLTNVGSWMPPKKAPHGYKAKDLIGIPWLVAFALRRDGWWLRTDIIWDKPNGMCESVKDRPTRSHEVIFLLTKTARYYYDQDAIRTPYAPDSVERTKRGRSSSHKWSDGGPGKQTIATDLGQACSNEKGANRRTVWSVTVKPYKGAHFATFPPDLIEPCVLAGCPAGGTVLDPFGGSGTTAQVAKYNGRKAILIELNPDYIKMIRKRLQQEMLPGMAAG
ncbi:MAG: site-specific DNA-methyltransferase [Planctomycetaceae bacterium]|nr:site-specific DNA-methyltransferase [Planctomycetaceae bacterium]